MGRGGVVETQLPSEGVPNVFEEARKRGEGAAEQERGNFGHSTRCHDSQPVSDVFTIQPADRVVEAKGTGCTCTVSSVSRIQKFGRDQLTAAQSQRWQ